MIPRRPMIDTCVIAGAHDGDAACKAALEAIKEHRALPMISAVIYAELARGTKHGGIARLPSGIEVVQVDVDVAVALAHHFPSESIKRLGSATAREYWNFDALIFASAVASRADAIVTVNLDDFEALLRYADHASEIGVKLLHPSAVCVDPPPPAPPQPEPPPPPKSGQTSLFDVFTHPTPSSAEGAQPAPLPAASEDTQPAPPPAAAEGTQPAPLPAAAEGAQSAPPAAAAERAQPAPPPAAAERAQSAPPPAAAERAQSAPPPAAAERAQPAPPPAAAERAQSAPPSAAAEGAQPAPPQADSENVRLAPTLIASDRTRTRE